MNILLSRLITLICCILIVFGCAKKHQRPETQRLHKMKYAIQVGAFNNLSNAVRLEQSLDAKGLDAYYFRHHSGLYKVRFGNYSKKSLAQKRANYLVSKNVIQSYYIVSPNDFAMSNLEKHGEGYLRKKIIASAKRYLGVPYQWGGTSVQKGFDCSGLTMVVYRVNGLDLPRTSYTQFNRGKYISKRQLKPGDLVFFDTMGKKRVSHVGIYIGRGRFIHAPGRGKHVKYANLSDSFFRKRYMGARRYF